MKHAYVTLLCNGDTYAPGVEALGASLRSSGTKAPIVVMATPDVSPRVRSRLSTQGLRLRDIDPLRSPKRAIPGLFARFDHVHTKLRVWQLTEFEKVVFLDADTLVVRNVDDLFERPELAAASDFLLPDRFNSGVMVLTPSDATFERMTSTLATTPSYDGGDQGFLNTFFADWHASPQEHRLPTGYNLFPALQRFMLSHPGLREIVLREAHILHYAIQKPWTGLPLVTGGSTAWWTAYHRAHPETDRPWKRHLHTAEDALYDHLVRAFLA